MRNSSNKAECISHRETVPWLALVAIHALGPLWPLQHRRKRREPCRSISRHLDKGTTNFRGRLATLPTTDLRCYYRRSEDQCLVTLLLCIKLASISAA